MIQKPQDNREILLIDMDNTLNQFWIEFQNFYNFHYSLNGSEEPLHIEKEGLIEYEILKNYLPDVPEEIRHVKRDKIFHSEFFWSEQRPYKNIEEVVGNLYDKYNVYIITSPWTSSPRCYEEKQRWVSKHLPFFDLNKIIFTRDKWLVKCDYIVDDAPFYLEREDCKTIAMDYIYNRHISVSYRADNWKDIGKYLGV
jgi:5'-nucleotidase